MRAIGIQVEQYILTVAIMSTTPLAAGFSTTSAGANERYVYDGPNVLADLKANGSTATTYLNDLEIDNHLRQTNATTEASYYLTDHLGSTAGLTGPSGKPA